MLGGSFNPAHSGHFAMSQFALKRLKLDEVWWLVSPQNPLKSRHEMASMPKRLQRARAVAARDPRFVVSDIEVLLGTQFTAHTLAALQKRFRGVKFVWLMGEDNWRSFHYWAEWTKIARTVPIAVFRRHVYSSRCCAAKSAIRLARHYVPACAAQLLCQARPPVWTILDNQMNPLSATLLRSQRLTRW